jgi:hypothetical protein
MKSILFRLAMILCFAFSLTACLGGGSSDGGGGGGGGGVGQQPPQLPTFTTLPGTAVAQVAGDTVAELGAGTAAALSQAGGIGDGSGLTVEIGSLKVLYDGQPLTTYGTGTNGQVYLLDNGFIGAEQPVDANFANWLDSEWFSGMPRGVLTNYDMWGDGSEMFNGTINYTTHMISLTKTRFH